MSLPNTDPLRRSNFIQKMETLDLDIDFSQLIRHKENLKYIKTVNIQEVGTKIR